MKVGDVVQLITGGPKMTVESLGRQEETSSNLYGGLAQGAQFTRTSFERPVRCVWFQGNDIRRLTFEEATLAAYGGPVDA